MKINLLALVMLLTIGSAFPQYMENVPIDVGRATFLNPDCTFKVVTKEAGNNKTKFICDIIRVRALGEDLL